MKKKKVKNKTKTPTKKWHSKKRSCQEKGREFMNTAPYRQGLTVSL